MLDALAEPFDPALTVRERFEDASERIVRLDDLPWVTAARRLDEVAPGWSHRVLEVRVVGRFAVVTVSLTLGGITRCGLGTCPLARRDAPRLAEEDALLGAAAKFGLGRSLTKQRAAPPYMLEAVAGLARAAGFEADDFCRAELGKPLGRLTPREAERAVGLLKRRLALASERAPRGRKS